MFQHKQLHVLASHSMTQGLSGHLQLGFIYSLRISLGYSECGCLDHLVMEVKPAGQIWV